MSVRKVIKIDVEKQDAYYINLEEGLDAIYNAIGNNCRMFECPVYLENGDVIYVDEEINFRPQDVKGGFAFPNFAYPIINNGLIVGSGEDGDDGDCASQLDEIKRELRFYALREAI